LRLILIENTYSEGLMGVIWDLCSGLGGFSEAFAQAGWTVIRIDNSKLVQYVPFTLDLDVRQWADWADDLPKPDVIVASPPCVEFSNGFYGPRPTALRSGIEFEPDMSIVIACRDIIETFKPKYWVIENVAGAIKFFQEELGFWSQKIGPLFLWGNFPRIILPPGYTYTKAGQDVWSSDPLRANKKAMIPFEVSFHLLYGIKTQRTSPPYI
jgi:hypothetical protein